MKNMRVIFGFSMNSVSFENLDHSMDIKIDTDISHFMMVESLQDYNKEIPRFSIDVSIAIIVTVCVLTVFSHSTGASVGIRTTSY